MTVAAAYPDKQPFPRILAVSLEGKTIADIVRVSEQLPTLPLDAFVAAERLLSGYLRDYNTDPDAKGIAIGVRGAHGSGKTHLIRYLIQSLPSPAPQVQVSSPDPPTASTSTTNTSGEGPPAPPPPVVAYVKVSAVSDFLALHRQIIAQIGQDRLRDVCMRWISQLAQDEARSVPVIQSAAAALAKDPNTVLDYLNSGLVSTRAVVAATADSVRGMRHYEDFLQVASFFVRPELRGEAYAWFMGLPQPDQVLRRLGVDNSLDAASTGEALHFVMGLFSRARQPLLLLVDQIERLLRHPSAEVKGANIGGLYSLAEWASEEHTFLCLAGAPDAWESMPSDFFGRLHRQFTLGSLNAADCLNLVKVYLHPKEPTFITYQAESELFPFGAAAVQRIADISQGNPRRFLRLAFRSFELAAPNHSFINAGDVDLAFKSVEEDFDRSTVLAEAESLILQAGLSYVESPTLPESLSADLAVIGPGGYLAFLDVSDAIFAQDEVERALRYAVVGPALRQKYPGTKYILIVAGYSSPQVQDPLRRSIDQYITYAPEAFTSQFRSVVSSLAPPTKAAPVTAAPQEQPPALSAQLVKYLERLVEDRTQETQARQSQLRGFSEFQQTQSTERVLDEAANLRAELEAQELARRTEAQQRKATHEVEERERQRAQAEREIQESITRSLIISGVLPAALILVGVVLLVSANQLPFPTSVVVPLGWTALSVGFVIGGLTAYYALLRESDVVRSIRRGEYDLEAIDRAALRLSRDRQPNPWRLVNSKNPLVRYLGARALAYRPELTWGSPNPILPRVAGTSSATTTEFEERIEAALRSEVNIDVYKALLSALTGAANQFTINSSTAAILRSLLRNATDPESLFILDALDRTDQQGLVSDEDRRPFAKHRASVAAHAVLRRRMDDAGLRMWQGENGAGMDAAVVAFAVQLAPPPDITSSVELTIVPTREYIDGARLARVFESSRSGAASNLSDSVRDSSDLATVRPQLVQRMIELYGLSGEESLGYYPDLRGAELYGEIYEFLVQFRLALAEAQLRLRAGTMAATP